MTIYTEQDLIDLRNQKTRRFIALGIPCALLLAAVIYAFATRLEWLASAATIIIGIILIAGYDLTLNPLLCYERHLNNCLHGRSRECDLPFVSLSDHVDLVEGVHFRQLLCADYDGKGRPYDRLFYFDAHKAFPDIKPGDMLHIVHHDLFVSNVYPQ